MRSPGRSSLARALSPSAGTEDDPQLYIDPEVCIDCGACEPVCPVTAIFPDYNVPEQYRDYIRINAEYYKK